MNATNGYRATIDRHRYRLRHILQLVGPKVNVAPYVSITAFLHFTGPI